MNSATIRSQGSKTSLGANAVERKSSGKNSRMANCAACGFPSRSEIASPSPEYDAPNAPISSSNTMPPPMPVTIGEPIASPTSRITVATTIERTASASSRLSTSAMRGTGVSSSLSK